MSAPATAQPPGHPRSTEHDDRRSTKATPRLGLRWQVTVATVLMFASVMGLTSWPAPAPARPLPAGISRVVSGLVMADPLRRALSPGQLQDSYNYSLDGSAMPGLGWALERPSGLYVGIKAHAGWAGWFASTVHAAGPAVAWHTVMTPGVPPRGSKARVLGVFAVQTASTQTSGAINYVLVAAVAKGEAYHWVVGYAHGVVAGASTSILWSSPVERIQPGWHWLPSRSLTVVTDGRRKLAVWFGARLAFSSDTLRLHIPAPFQAYLEVQSHGPAFQARFRDFWVARTSPLVVDGVPAGSTVTLQSASARWRANAGRQGTASFALPAYALNGTGRLSVESRRHGRVNYGPVSYGPLSYAGGDVLRVAS